MSGEDDWTATLPPYDPEQARQLIATTGRPNGPLTISTAGAGVAVSMKEVYERDLGLTVEVLEPDWQDFLSDLAQQRLPVFTLSWVADYADPSAFLDALFHSGSPDNYLGYHNPEVDDLLDRARAEQNREERIRLYREAQQRILDDGVVIPLYHDVEYWLVAPAVHGLQVTPLGVLALETVWLSR